MTACKADVSLFRAGDEKLIPALVRSVYGETYDRRFYDPQTVARMASGGLILVVVHNGCRVIGMTGFCAEGSANRRLFRTYRRMVAPEARGLGLAHAMEVVGERLLLERGLAEAVYAQIEAHSPSNRLLAGCGFVLTAVEPAVEDRPAQTFLFKDLTPDCNAGERPESIPLKAEYTISDGPLERRINISCAVGLTAVLDGLCCENRTLELFLPRGIVPAAELCARGFFRCGAAPCWRENGGSEIFMKVSTRAVLPEPPLQDKQTMALWETVRRALERSSR